MFTHFFHFAVLIFLSAWSLVSAGAEVCAPPADGSPQALAKFMCEKQCSDLECGKYFDKPDFSCSQKCREPEPSNASIALACAKGASINVAVGILMSPINLARLINETASKSSEEMQNIEKDPARKRQLAFEAALLTTVSKKSLADYSPDEIKKADEKIHDIEVFDIMHKRAEVQEQAARDHDYEAWLRKYHVPIASLDQDLRGSDEVVNWGQARLKELGFRWQCYGPKEKTELACEAVVTLLTPTLTKILVAKLPVPSGSLVKAFLKDEGSGKPQVQSMNVVLGARDVYTAEFLNAKTTTTEQNKAYIESKKNPQDRVYFVAEHAELKENNDRLKNKNFVTAMTNRFHQLMASEIDALRANNPGLKAELPGSSTETIQQDFKAFRIALSGKIPPDIDAQLDRAFQTANSKFQKELRDRHLIRPDDDPSKWFRAGRGVDADNADLRARQAREQAPGVNKMASDQDPQIEAGLQKKYEVVQQTRAGLEHDYASMGIMQGKPGEMIPEKQVFGLIKNYKDPQALAQAVRSRYGAHSFNTADAQRLIDYDKQVNQFPVGIHEAERHIVNLDKGKKGGMTLDFRNMNIANKEATAEALAKSKSIPDAVTRARAGEVKVTEVFKSKRDEFKKMRAGAECTGDDCAEAFISTKMSTREKQQILQQAASNPKLRETRIAFVQDGVKNVNDRNTIGTHGEGIEKYMRSRLQASLPPEVIDRLTFATDMQTRQLNTGRVDLIIGSAPELKLTPDQLTRIHEALARAVEDQNAFLWKEEKIRATYTVGADAASTYIVIPIVPAPPTSQPANKGQTP